MIVIFFDLCRKLSEPNGPEPSSISDPVNSAINNESSKLFRPYELSFSENLSLIFFVD